MGKKQHLNILSWSGQLTQWIKRDYFLYKHLARYWLDFKSKVNLANWKYHMHMNSKLY